jgi:hypothetical protein
LLQKWDCIAKYTGPLCILLFLGTKLFRLPSTVKKQLVQVGLRGKLIMTGSLSHLP